MANDFNKKYEGLVNYILSIDGYTINEKKYKHDPCIFCDKRKTYVHTEKIKPLNQDGKYSDTHTICHNCYSDIYLSLRLKYKELF